MKICYLADAKSVHTQRWVKSISTANIDVIIISFREAKIEGIPVFTISTPKILNVSPSAAFWSRFHYLFGKNQVKKILNDFKPDILHSFWATSYGFLGARMKHPNFLVSVWGQDITKSPNKSLIMKWIIKYVFKKAKFVYCTSKYLVNETKIYINDNKKIIRIPFGIENNFFVQEQKDKNNIIIIGSTKSLEKNYGLDILIKAFSKVHNKFPNIRLKLVGSGTYKNKLVKLINKLGIKEYCELIPAIDHKEMPEVLSYFDIYVMPSVEPESFGVAALEASAVGIPVIGSGIGGIPEIVINNRTGILVPPNDEHALTQALTELLKSKQKRIDFGQNGRKFVKAEYQWENNLQKLIQSYHTLLR